MNIIHTAGSLFLWICGSLFFLFSFFILLFCLLFLSRETTFKTARRLFSILLKIMGVNLEVEGSENVDPSQTYLIMGNHQSLFDIFVIPVAIPLTFTGVEAAYHFSIPVWGLMIRLWGCIPIQRGDLEKAKQSLKQAEKTLAHGLSIAILPEGHRTTTGKMAPFKKGPFHLARATGAPILPFAIKGLYQFQKKGRFLLTPGRVRVKIGKPVPFDAYAGLSVEKLRDKLFNRIQDLGR